MRNSQSPSIYSIYNNALPYYLDRLDICNLAEDNEGFVPLFVSKVLSGQLSMQVNTLGLTADKLRHLYFEARNFEKTFGAKSFGFGYPLLIDTFAGDLLVAPVFIWHLTMEPAQAKADSWVFKFSEQQFVQPNYQVIKFLLEKYGLDLKKRVEEMAQGPTPTLETLATICNELAERLHFSTQGEIQNPVPSPGIDEMGPFAEQGALYWAGVLSLFPPQNTAWTPGEYKPEEVLNPKLLSAEDETFVFPYLPADPEQASALELIAAQKIAVVEGEDALGKTQTLVNLLINALSRGKKCVVVSERVPALKFTQNLLAKAGLNQLHFLLDDALYDKMPLLELLRVAAGGTTREIRHDEDDFSLKKNKFLRNKAKADQAYQAVSAKVFGDNTWTETTGLFLASNRVEGKELLASQLNAQDFYYTTQEYEKLKQGILKCHPLFQQVKTLSHPLGNLHEDIFTKQKPEEGLRLVKTLLKEFLGKAAQLQHRYIGKTDAYAARLHEHYNSYYDLLSAQSNALSEKISSYGDSLGSEFQQAGASSFSFSFLLSSKKKKIKSAREEVARLFKTLIKDYSERQYFDFQVTPCKEGMHIPKLTANVRRFREALAQWHGRIATAVQEEVNRLNSKTAHPSLDVKEQITGLEYSLDVLLEELNDANLYQKKLENKTLTIPQRQKYLESIIEQLETTQLNLRDFDLFYQWQSTWLDLGPLGQKVIRALVKVKPDDWMAAFESWYFSNLLARLQSANLPTEASLVVDYARAWHALRPLVLNQIRDSWQSRQVSEIKKLKKANRQAYQMIFEKSGQAKALNLPLAEIIEPAFDAVTTFLPVLFITPHVALNVLPRHNGYFDYVIFDEANKFPVESAAAIAPLGQKTVLFGSDTSYGSETSLLQYALESEVPTAKITNRYFPPAQAGIAENPATATEYTVDNVEGRFYELEGTNHVEAQHIIRLLNQIKQTPQRVYPSVGIVTLTVEQRDQISSYLLKLKQQSALGSEKIQQLERNGMSVLFIDELFGQQFDILILSCTFGPINLKGTMTKKLIFLNTREGVSHIRMLVNKPAQSLYVVHSIPEEQQQEFLSKKWEEGTWLLAHLIRLAEARRSGNEVQVKASLEALGKLATHSQGKSIFAQEIANALRPYLEQKRLNRQIPIEDIQLPLLIKPGHPDSTPLVVHPDGFFADTEFTSHLWEHKQREKIEATGMAYLPVWSVQWLKNPVQEARSLASKIIKHDSGFKSQAEPEKGEIERNNWKDES